MSSGITRDRTATRAGDATRWGDAARGRTAADIGRPVDLDLSGAWLVDPVAGRQGRADLVVRGGILEAVTWLDDADRDGGNGAGDGGVVVAPGFVDLHAHFREPGNEAAETIASGLAAAAHGGFTTVCMMPNTTPPIDRAAMVVAARAAAAASGSPVRLLPYGAATLGRAGEQLAPLGELTEAGAIGFSDDGSPIQHPDLFRNALSYAGMLGLPLVDHPEDLELTSGAEADDGLVATVLGLRGWPAAAEANAVARDVALLGEVVRDVPGARLHLTHLSTAASIDVVRRAKASGLPVTCDVTPHHLALTDEWLAGARRWAWAALAEDGSARDPWRDRALVAGPYDSALRVNPPLRSAPDARACLDGLLDGTVDAIATDHAPHTEVDRAVEFGLARPGIAGIETALGLLLEAVGAGLLPLARLVEALTTGPARAMSGIPAPHFAVGEPADLVVFDRGTRWIVNAGSLLTKGHGSPLLGRSLSGAVLLTIAGGRLAYEGAAPD
ncbi:MAG TPA: dihydroorotase [Candidatus Limnocylindria bacterium]|nr:dihydroorotase [Candidatus Limnocylindria bacterium]